MAVDLRAPAAHASAAPLSRDLRTPHRVPGWRTADVLRAAALVLGVYLAARLLWVAYPILLVSFLGVLFGLAVARGTDWLEQWRIPRPLGSTLIVLTFLGLLVGIGAWAGPTLRRQLPELRTAVPQALEKVEAWWHRHENGILGQMLPNRQPGAGQQQPAPAQGAGAQGRAGGETAAEPPADQGAQPSGQLSNLPDTLAGQVGAVARYLFSFLSSTVAVISGFVLIVFMAIYIGSNPGLYFRGLLHLIPHRARPRGAEVLNAIGVTLRRWLVSQLIAMVVIGTVTSIALKLIGVKAAFALGILAGLLEFVPMVGPLLSAIPAVAMGLLDSPQKALLVVLAYVAIQFLENHVLIPLLMKEGVDLPPVLTLIGLSIMAIVFGFLGMLVAVPLLAAIVVAVKMLYVEDVMGDDVDVGLDSA